MKKINNKGMTVVEFIVVFAILMFLVVSMMNIIMNIKKTNTSTTLEKELLTYKTNLTKVISDDLIKKNFRELKNCDTSGMIVSCDLIFKYTNEENEEVSISKKLSVDSENMIITYDEIKYSVPEKSYLTFNGIVNIKVDNKILIIDIPIYEIDKLNDNINYGISIKHPISL